MTDKEPDKTGPGSELEALAVPSLVAGGVGEPAGGAGSALVRIVVIEGVSFHVKVACGSPADGESWWGPANDLMGDLLMRAMGVRPRLQTALVAFTPSAFGGLRSMSPRSHPGARPSDPIGYGRSTVADATEGRAIWPADPELRAEVVAQDLVLRWVGAGHDHLDKGFLDVDGFPVAIDLGGLDVNTVWQTNDPDRRVLDRDYGGIWDDIVKAREERASAAARAKNKGSGAIEAALRVVPEEWAEPPRSERMARALHERLDWVLAPYEN